SPLIPLTPSHMRHKRYHAQQQDHHHERHAQNQQQIAAAHLRLFRPRLALHSSRPSQSYRRWQLANSSTDLLPRFLLPNPYWLLPAFPPPQPSFILEARFDPCPLPYCPAQEPKRSWLPLRATGRPRWKPTTPIWLSPNAT